MRVQPYLYFDGRCEEAIGFYKDVVSAEVIHVFRFGDNPGTPAAEEVKDKVMHAVLRIGESTILASDGACGGKPIFQGFSLALTIDDESEVERVFKALAKEGKVTLPLMSTSFASRMAMVADKFGVPWTLSNASA